MTTFYQKTIQACKDDSLSEKLNAALETQIQSRERVCKELGEGEPFRKLGADVRDAALAGLDTYLIEFVNKEYGQEIKGGRVSFLNFGNRNG